MPFARNGRAYVVNLPPDVIESFTDTDFGWAKNSLRNTGVSKEEAAAFMQDAQTGAVVRCISDIPAQKLRWLWPGRIPLGKLTLFAGDPGLGKSFVTLDIVARVTRGTDWPDARTNTKPGSAIILSAEDDPADTIRPRLEAAGADLSKIHILEAVRRIKPNGESVLDHFSLQNDITALQDAAVSLNDVSLIVIDPISAYLGGTDSHVNSKVRALLAPLATISQTLRIAVLAVDHLSKSNRPAIYRPNGSIAFTAAARAVWFFAKDMDDPVQRLMLPGKLNLAPEQTGLGYTLKENDHGMVAVVWGGPVTMSADSVLQTEAMEERSERMEAMDWLREQLSSGSVSASQLRKDANSAGLSWITVRRAKDALGIAPCKNSFAGGWSWELPAPEDAHSEDAHSEDAHPHDTQVSTFEQAIENINVNGNRAAQDAHVSLMSTLGPAIAANPPINYALEADGLGATCNSCNGRFRTVAGWRAHISRNRCLPRVNGAVTTMGEQRDSQNGSKFPQT